ncbi:hypothetical protein NQ176_g8357 [Zarea fungicola]|uniref:Uncharacterized protein n=1 Tax=Zarea fungicola TaxID=93591 RepID=A0ACC1MU84_9HYPO|nr:hypothetical protein NQ176_g8357 [Lecanicillium fungicola]
MNLKCCNICSSLPAHRRSGTRPAYSAATYSAAPALERCQVPAHTSHVTTRRCGLDLAYLVDRDAEDMDMGFGTSRYEDEEDFQDQDIKLSAWGDDDDGADGGQGGGGKKRKRNRKRKGDANSAADVLRVMEQRRL